jgi:hypothetical protein
MLVQSRLSKFLIAAILLSYACISCAFEFAGLDSDSRSRHSVRTDSDTKAALRTLWEAQLAIKGHHVEPLLRSSYKYEVGQQQEQEQQAHNLLQGTHPCWHLGQS